MCDMLRKSIAGGIMISLGGAAYLSIPDKTLGAFVFSLGLLSILIFEKLLFTGLTGHVRWFSSPTRSSEIMLMSLLGVTDYTPSKRTLFITLIGNLAGCQLMGWVLRIANPELTIKADELLLSRGARLLEVFQTSYIFKNIALGFMCGILMYIAVDGYKKSKVCGWLVTIMCVASFILCGFEHSIADAFYIDMSTFGDHQCHKYFFLFLVIVGNLLGGQFMALFNKTDPPKFK